MRKPRESEQQPPCPPRAGAAAAAATDPVPAALKAAARRTPNPLLTLGETARRLGVSERYVRDATRANRLPYVWVNGVKLVLEADLKAFRKRHGLGNDSGA